MMAAAVDKCGACGEQPLVCSCGDAFCPCQRVNDPPDIGYLMQELERCEGCVCMAAAEMVESFKLLPLSERSRLSHRAAMARLRRAEMRKGGTWKVNNS